MKALLTEDVASDQFDPAIRTKEQMYDFLVSHGIERNSKSWFDYEKSKKALNGVYGCWTPDYQQKIEWITDYLGLYSRGVIND